MGLESVRAYHPNMRDDGSSGSSEVINGDSIGRLHPFNSRMTGENRKRRAAFIRFKISPLLVPLVLRPALRGDQSRNCRYAPSSLLKRSPCPEECGGASASVCKRTGCSQSPRLRRIAPDQAKGIRCAVS